MCGSTPTLAYDTMTDIGKYSGIRALTAMALAWTSKLLYNSEINTRTTVCFFL